MNSLDPHQIAIQPIISYPREVEVGKAYLVTVDIQAVIEDFQWPYSEEEFVLQCILEATPPLVHETIGEPFVILNRFGGSFGPALFLLTTAEAGLTSNIQVNLISNGILIETIRLNNIRLLAQDDESISSLVSTHKPSISVSRPSKAIFSPKRNIYIEFDPTLYIQRETASQEARIWQQGQGTLLTITAPPAMGKTWFVQALQRSFIDEGLNVLSIDLNKLVSSSKHYPQTFGEIDPENLSLWLTMFMNEIRHECDGLPNIDPMTTELAVCIEQIASHATNNCWPNEDIFLFVDGAETLTQEGWHYVEEQILIPFAIHKNWRLIVALRSEQRLRSFLLRLRENRLILGGYSQTESSVIQHGLEQIEKLNQNQLDVEAIVQPEEYLKIVPGYDWSHPGLNTFLFSEIQAQYTENRKIILDDQLIEKAVSSLTDLPTDSASDIVDTLKSISRLSDEWVMEDLIAELDISLIDGWNLLENLTTHLLVLHVGGNKYGIERGLLSFMRATLADERLK